MAPIEVDQGRDSKPVGFQDTSLVVDGFQNHRIQHISVWIEAFCLANRNHQIIRQTHVYEGN